MSSRRAWYARRRDLIAQLIVGALALGVAFWLVASFTGMLVPALGFGVVALLNFVVAGHHASQPLVVIDEAGISARAALLARTRSLPWGQISRWERNVKHYIVLHGAEGERPIRIARTAFSPDGLEALEAALSDRLAAA